MKEKRKKWWCPLDYTREKKKALYADKNELKTRINILLCGPLGQATKKDSRLAKISGKGAAEKGKRSRAYPKRGGEGSAPRLS